MIYIFLFEGDVEVRRTVSADDVEAVESGVLDILRVSGDHVFRLEVLSYNKTEWRIIDEV